MTQVTMPQLGESVTEGTILQWLKQPGDAVALDDSLCEIETEKVTAELPSPFEGIMGQILVPEGETVVVGAPLCEVQESTPGAAPTPNGTAAHQAPSRGAASGAWSGGPMAVPLDEDAAAEPAPATPVARAAVASPPSTPRPTLPTGKPDTRERFYSPAVMRLAHEHALDLSTVTGTGIGGRVTRKDVEKALTQPPPQETAAPAAAQQQPVPPTEATTTASAAAYEVVPFSATRRTIAENLKRSNLEAPQAWTMVEADITALMALRNREKDRFRQQEGIELTLLPYFTSAVCETLRDFPVLNARWEGDELRQYRSLEIGIAVASEGGLVVPVVHAAGDLSVTGLAKRIADLVQRANTRKLRLEDIEGGTFTVNNTGSFGSIASKPIVNYPQVGIVTMERAVKRPVVLENDAIAVRWMMNVCLSFDHRAMDGLAAGGFLAALKGRLEGIV
ncbi:MAG TPA: dihydrolipoamide acetyltransferase family protein [Tepidiformaceae bacterium]|nr:dihydrolipoamide acetyltransferase family protein [Tepidiformaceae bacterium]